MKLLTFLKYFSLTITTLSATVALFWEPRDQTTKKLKPAGWGLLALLLITSGLSFWIQSLEFTRAQEVERKGIEQKIEQSNRLMTELARLSTPFRDVTFSFIITVPFSSEKTKALAEELHSFAEGIWSDENLFTEDDALGEQVLKAGVRILLKGRIGEHSHRVIEFTKQNTVGEYRSSEALRLAFNWPIPILTFSELAEDARAKIFARFYRPYTPDSQLPDYIKPRRDKLPFFFEYNLDTRRLRVVVNSGETLSREWHSDVVSFLDFFPCRLKVQMPPAGVLSGNEELSSLATLLMQESKIDTLVLRVGSLWYSLRGDKFTTESSSPDIRMFRTVLTNEGIPPLRRKTNNEEHQPTRSSEQSRADTPDHRSP